MVRRIYKAAFGGDLHEIHPEWHKNLGAVKRKGPARVAGLRRRLMQTGIEGASAGPEGKARKLRELQRIFADLGVQDLKDRVEVIPAAERTPEALAAVMGRIERNRGQTDPETWAKLMRGLVDRLYEHGVFIRDK